MLTNPAREERHQVPAQGGMESNMTNEELELENSEGEEQKARTDWKALARKWENRAKENAEKAKVFDENQTKLTELSERAEKAESELAAARAQAERTTLLNRIASETGIPAHFIQGESEDEMRTFAKEMSEWHRPAAPKISLAGKFDSDADDVDAAKKKLAQQMFGN